MSVTATIRQSSSVGGVSFAESKSITGDGQIVHNVSVPAADAGELTTRDSAGAGEMTMDETAHGIATGDRVDLYWTISGVKGRRRGVTVGTVSGAAVPISGGSGDDLPSLNTPESGDTMVVCFALELDIFVDGDNVDAALAALAKNGQVTFIDTDASEAEIAHWNVGEGAVKMWHDEDGDDNPFAAQNIGRVYISHEDTTAAVAKLAIIYNNVAG